MAIAAVMVVSFLLMGLMVVSMKTGDRSLRSSARDRNSELALAVAEAGVQEAMAKIEASGGNGVPGSLSGSTSSGTYHVTIVQSPGRYVITSVGTVGGDQLGRTRRVRVTLGPPGVFRHALFSHTSIELKNNDVVTGDVWANDSVMIEQGGSVDGNVTAARSWLQLKQNSKILGDAWSGGYNPTSSWAIQLENGAEIFGKATASVSAPTDPITCGGEDQSKYEVNMGSSSARIHQALTTWGQVDGGTVGGTYSAFTCTAAAVPLPMPQLVVNRWNYDQATYHEFSSVAEFQTWLTSNQTSLQGTFVINDPAPSQTNRINLTGVVVTGSTTIITNSPVFTNGITDTPTGDRVFVLASSYKPPVASACSVDHDNSECAIHIKNDFTFNSTSQTCPTAVLIYANRGPAAVKNNSELCGAIYADGILVKNNQSLRWDARIEDVAGFGSAAYTRDRWEERAS